ncbi:hypothetical protein L195_g051685, partial [Trifolium pratense]
RFLVCPSDVDVEVSALKAKICDTLDMVGEDIKAEIGKRDLEVVSLLREAIARASLKRLTMFNHEEAETSMAAAVSARKAVDDMLLHVFNNCLVDSKLFKCLEDQRIETERIAQEAALLNQGQVLMIDYPEDSGSSSDKGKAPMEADVDHLRVLEQAIEEQRSDHQVLASKVDKLDSKVDALNNKFDIIIALLQKP